MASWEDKDETDMKEMLEVVLDDLFETAGSRRRKLSLKSSLTSDTTEQTKKIDLGNKAQALIAYITYRSTTNTLNLARDVLNLGKGILTETKALVKWNKVLASWTVVLAIGTVILAIASFLRL